MVHFLSKSYRIIILLLIGTNMVFGQQKWMTKDGVTTFEASVRSFEEVKATSQKTTAVIESNTGNFAVLIPVKSFKFKNALMQEHFNENYMESDQYPNAAFSGKIINMDPKTIPQTATSYQIAGNLALHGVTKPLKIPVMLKRDEKQLLLSTTFQVTAADFDIKVPRIIRKKIAEDIQITVTLPFDL